MKFTLLRATNCHKSYVRTVMGKADSKQQAAILRPAVFLCGSEYLMWGFSVPIWKIHFSPFILKTNTASDNCASLSTPFKAAYNDRVRNTDFIPGISVFTGHRLRIAVIPDVEELPVSVLNRKKFKTQKIGAKRGEGSLTQDVGDFKKLLLGLKKRVLLIVAVTLCAGAACFLFSKFFIKPLYRSQALLIVNASVPSSQIITYDDVTLSQKLVDTYSIILKSNTILNQVIKNLNLPVTTKQLAAEISVTGVDTTEIINLMVTNNDPREAAAIASEIINLAPDEIIRTMKVGSVEVISPAETDAQPVAPNILMYTLIGALTGLVGTLTIIMTIELYDDRLKTEEDVQSKLGFPVIGIIPNIDRAAAKREY